MVDKFVVTLEIEFNVSKRAAGQSFADRNGRGVTKNRQSSSNLTVPQRSANYGIWQLRERCLSTDLLPAEKRVQLPWGRPNTFAIFQRCSKSCSTSLRREGVSPNTSNITTFPPFYLTVKSFLSCWKSSSVLSGLRIRQTTKILFGVSTSTVGLFASRHLLSPITGYGTTRYGLSRTRLGRKRRRRSRKPREPLQGCC